MALTEQCALYSITLASSFWPPWRILRHLKPYINLEIAYIETFASATKDSDTSVRLLGLEHLTVVNSVKCRH
jgi:hypothetical protein